MFPLFYLYRNPEPILEVFFHLMKWVRFAGECPPGFLQEAIPLPLHKWHYRIMMTLITEGQWPC